MGVLRVKALWALSRVKDRAYYQKTLLPGGASIQKDLPYGEEGFPEHRMDLIRPEGARGPLPVIVYIHGGGWFSGDKETLYRQLGVRLALLGFCVVMPDYRLAPKHHFPAPAADVCSVLDTLPGLAKSYGLDLSRLFLCGDSAGAYLGALSGAIQSNPVLQKAYGLRPRQPVAKLGLLCGVYDLNRFMAHNMLYRFFAPAHFQGLLGVKDYPAHPLYPYMDIIRWITGDFPPSFVLSSQADPFCRSSEEMLAALNAQGVYTEQKIYPAEEKLPHVFFTRETYAQSDQALCQLADFLN